MLMIISWSWQQDDVGHRRWWRKRHSQGDQHGGAVDISGDVQNDLKLLLFGSMWYYGFASAHKDRRTRRPCFGESAVPAQAWRYLQNPKFMVLTGPTGHHFPKSFPPEKFLTSIIGHLITRDVAWPTMVPYYLSGADPSSPWSRGVEGGLHQRLHRSAWLPHLSDEDGVQGSMIHGPVGWMLVIPPVRLFRFFFFFRGGSTFNLYLNMLNQVLVMMLLMMMMMTTSNRHAFGLQQPNQLALGHDLHR